MARILMIEDDEEMCEELSFILKHEHYDVNVCYDGERGIELIKSGHYDVVFLDLKIPGLNGYEVLKYIKREHPDVKVIVLTGSPLSKKLMQEEEEEESILLNYNDYRENVLKEADGVINKPFDVEKVLAKLKGLIKE